MPSGYLLKQFGPLRISAAAPGPTSTVLFTVPAGHIYLLKGIHSGLLSSPTADANGGNPRLWFEVSDSAGANFRQFSTVQNSAAAANATAFSAIANVTSGMMHNMVFLAGQSLRATYAFGTYNYPGASIDLKVDIADYTI